MGPWVYIDLNIGADWTTPSAIQVYVIVLILVAKSEYAKRKWPKVLVT